MFKRSIEYAARARWTLPVALVLALLAMAVNETSYRHAAATYQRAITLADMRLQAADALHALIALDAAAAAHAATGSPAERERFEHAWQHYERSQSEVLALLRRVDGAGSAEPQGLHERLVSLGAQLRGQIEGPVAARTPQAAAAQRQALAELDARLDQVLGQAATLQEQARASVRAAYQTNRLALHALVLLALLALVLLRQRLRRADARQAQEQQRLASLVQERTAELRALASHLVGTREDERSRLARELHDEMGGLLTAMKLELARLRRTGPLPEAAAPRLAGLEARLNEGIALKRRIVENLRPSSLEQLGLKVALELLCTDTAAVSGLRIATDLAVLPLPKDAELALFRVVQESLNNACKHAQARQVTVRLQGHDGQAVLTVDDDGRGFDPQAVPAGRHGLSGMRLRLESQAGSLQVDSAPGAGTRVTARLPLAAAQPLRGAEPGHPPGAEPPAAARAA